MLGWQTKNLMQLEGKIRKFQFQFFENMTFLSKNIDKETISSSSRLLHISVYFEAMKEIFTIFKIDHAQLNV